VSPTGLDSNSGTLAAPWKTLQHAVSVAAAGATINARAGVYAEQVVFPNSGNATAGYLTLQNYTGETPVIDGTSIGTSVPNMGLVNLTDVSYIQVRGFEIRNFTSNTANFVPAGIIVSGSGSNIQLRNNYVHNITTTVNSAAGDAFGIQIYGSEAPASINNLIIDGNEVAFLKTGSSESVTLNGNVENFQVTNNKVHDNSNIGIDFIGFEGTSPNPTYDQARNGLVSGNLVYNITSNGNPAYGNNSYGADGLYVDGGTNIIIERNIVHNTDIGAEIASEHSGHVGSLITLRNNLIYSNNLIGISLGGAGSGNGGADSCGIYNNTLYQNDTINSGSGEIGLQNHVSNIQFANNLVVSSSQGVFVTTQTTVTTSSLNGDLYFSPSGTTQTWTWNGHNYSSFSAWQTGSGNDANGKYVNPLLINATTSFVPVTGSPAINAGVALTAAQAGTLDLSGNARVQGAAIDIGAYEQ